MDCKYTTQSVRTSKTIFRQTLEHPFDTEVTLPDYCPDIHRVLKCRINAKIAQRSAEGGRVNLDGIISLNLIYVDKDSSVRSFDMQTPFSKNADIISQEGEMSVTAICRTDFCNCRAVNERAIEVHGAISIAVSVDCCTETKILTDIDHPTVFQMRSTAPSFSPSGRCEKYLLLNDEVSLPDRCPAIRNILRYDMSAVIKDKKIVGSKVVVKGELIMNVLYFGEETADCESFSETVPFSQVMEISGINDGCTVLTDAEVISAELMPRTGMSGDMRVVSLSVKMYLTCSAFCDGEVPYLLDAYSTKYAMQVESEEVCFQKVTNTLSEPCHLKYTLDIPVSDGVKIVDMWSNPTILSTATEQDCVIVKGNIQFCIIARDKSGESSYYERTYDFESRYELKLPQKFEIKCSAKVLGCLGIINGSSADVNAELNITIDVIEQTLASVLCSAEFGDEYQRRCSPSSVVVYFAADGERVWDIARRYNTSPDAIASTNAIRSDKVDGNKTLVIPSI